MGKKQWREGECGETGRFWKPTCRLCHEASYCCYFFYYFYCYNTATTTTGCWYCSSSYCGMHGCLPLTGLALLGESQGG